MRWKIISLYLLLGIGGGLLLNYTVLISHLFVPAANTQAVAQRTVLSPSPVVIPRVGLPQTLIIPKLNLTASIERVGMDDVGRMAVPKEPQNVGWYEFGSRPGEMGSAVIDGHLDTATSPAIFANLRQLQAGDELRVIDTNNHTHTFIVSRVTAFEDSTFPIETVFSQRDKVRLNLITCEGIWNRNTQLYSQRLVVFSEERDN